jgi:hypothetical protein
MTIVPRFLSSSAYDLIIILAELSWAYLIEAELISTYPLCAVKLNLYDHISDLQNVIL